MYPQKQKETMRKIILAYLSRSFDPLLPRDGTRAMTGDLKIGQSLKLLIDDDEDTYLYGNTWDDRIYFFTGGNVKFGIGNNSISVYVAFLPNSDGGLPFGSSSKRWGGFYLYPYTDATRPAAGNAGNVIFNDDDKSLNVDDGTNWRDMAGNIT